MTKIINDIGIVGQGFVGNAVKQVFSQHYPVHTFDLVESKSSCRDLAQLVIKSDVVFVCLPTPMEKTGECDVSLVEETVSLIETTAKYRYKKDFPVLIKSTIPPGTTKKLVEQNPYSNIVFNPEFLTEANAVEDYHNQERVVLGINTKDCNHIGSMFNKVFPNATVIKTKSSVAEMVKYVTNCFLSTKVSFANEIYQVCHELNIDYGKVIEYSKYDKRLGNSHWNVPGPDGDFGYGGHCFPKDMAALKFLANFLGVDTSVLDGVIKKNDQVRIERDWEKQIGRAVSKDYFKD